MASIFLSHSSKNNGWARKLQAWLEAKHHRSLFLDFDREAGLKAGDLWERQLYAKLRQCQVVLALVSRDWLDSRWCFAEAVQAREKGKRLVLARIDDVDTSTLFRDAQHLDFTGDEADALARLETALVDVFDLQPDREPYPGLVPFDQRDAGVFVGRDLEIVTLLEALESMRLKSRSGGERLLLLLGASGSGKSSLVRAGALPRLHRLPERWQLLPPMRPGQDPVRELALCLAVMLRRDPEAVAGRLAAAGQDSGGPLQALADEVRLEAGQPEAAVLLVLDQMEELLHLSETQACGRFLDVLRRALEHGDGRFLVLATLRSEYLGEVQLLPFLTTPTPLPYREQTLDPVPLDRLEAIIREPGRRWPQPVEFADRLVERMVRDTGTRDALPLLAFTLNRLWRDTPARADGVFQLEEYERLGGLEGSVQTAADEAFDLRRRTPAELKVLRETFVPGLVRVDAAGVRTRRRAFLADLAPAARGLLNRFVDQGLLVTNRDPEGRETVEVAHEALLRTWPQLDTWLAEDQDALRLLDGLERTARDWEAGKRSPELLAHRGARLAEVQALLGQPRFRQVIGETERHYLEASDQAEAERAAREREEQERRVRDAERIAEEQRKVARRTKMGALIALVLMAAAVGGGAIAWWQRGEAQHNAEQAQRNTEKAQRNELRARAALASIEAGSGSPATAIRVALTAAPMAEAVNALYHGLHEVREIRRFAGHEDTVSSVAFSPDGLTLATGSGDKTARLWEVASGKEIAVLRGHEGRVSSVAFSPDGLTLASGSWNDTARLWEVASGKEIAVLREGVRSFAFSPDGRMLATGGDHTARLWEVATGKEIAVIGDNKAPAMFVAFSPDGRTLATSAVNDGDNAARLWEVATGKEIAVIRGRGGVMSLAFSPDGRVLATGGHGDNAARLWEVATGREIAVLRGHESSVSSVAFSPDGRMLATGGDHHDKTARLWEVATGKEIAVLRSHEDGVVSVAFSPDGRMLATGSRDKTARLWEVASGKEIAVLRSHEEQVSSAAFSPNSRKLVTASDDDIARLWEVATGKELAVLRGHRGGVMFAAFSPDGGTLATGSQDNTARLWEVATGKEIAVLRGHDSWVFSVAFSPDGRTVVTASDDDTARLWEVATGKEIATLLRGYGRNLRFTAGHLSFMAFSPDGRTLAMASVGDTARLWEVATGREIAVLRGHKAPVMSVAFSPDGRTVVTGSQDNTARLWEVATGREIAVLRGYKDNVNFSPDGRTVVTGSQDNTARLWEVATGREIAVLRGHEDDIWSVAFSPDGRTLVTGSQDNTARLWEVATGREIAVLRGHDSWVISVTFSPDGRTLATGSQDNTARLWEVATGKEIAVLRGHKSPLMSAAFSPDGRTLVTVSQFWPDKTARLWPVGQGLIDLGCARVHFLPLSERDRGRFGIENEWCTTQVSAELRAKLPPDELETNSAAWSFVDQGNALLNQANPKAGEEADVLYRQAGDKYAAALRLKPDMHEALNSWGSTLITWSSKKDGGEAEGMLKEAEDKLLRAEKLKVGSASYNLACLAARRGDEEQSLSFLERANEHGNLPARAHLLSDPDLASIRDKLWFREFLDAAFVAQASEKKREPDRSGSAVASVRPFLVFFDSDKASLTTEARKVIQYAATQALAQQDYRLEVVGHDDTFLPNDQSLELSQKRAAATARYLVEQGVAASRIFVGGVGSKEPLITTAKGVREPQNRFVKVQFVPLAEKITKEYLRQFK